MGTCPLSQTIENTQFLEKWCRSALFYLSLVLPIAFSVSAG
jgi:hypothetical protein